MLARVVVAALGIIVWGALGFEARAQSNLAGKSNRDNLDLQEKCASQAEKVFLQLGWKHDQGDVYQSHYNTTLNKCFMSIETHRGLSIGKNLFDAYEQRTYASYFWIADKVKKYWEVPPKLCELTPTLREKRNCSSDDEYEAFVARYMQR